MAKINKEEQKIVREFCRVDRSGPARLPADTVPSAKGRDLAASVAPKYPAPSNSVERVFEEGKKEKRPSSFFFFFFFFFHFVVVVKLLKRNKMKQPEKLEVSVWDALKKKKNGRDFSGVERRVEATYR